jgi:hypothetical protein
MNIDSRSWSSLADEDIVRRSQPSIVNEEIDHIDRRSWLLLTDKDIVRRS